MSKHERININKIFLKAHRLGVKMAIKKAAETGTPLIIYEDGKIKRVKPRVKYICVPIPPPKKRAVTKKKSRTS